MFENCKTFDEAKKLYRRLALLLHPDKGGETDLMVLLQDTYEAFLKKFKEPKSSIFSSEERKYYNTYEDIRASDPAVQDIFREMYSYAQGHPRFETTYLDSLSEFAEENGYLTSHQYNSLVKIYYSFRMYKAKKH